MVAAVDIDELPEATASKVRAALADVDFEQPAVGPAPGMADGYQYDLVVEDRTTRSMTARDPFLSPGLRALLDVLMPLAQPE
jgi:hypothetical protein